MRTWFITGTSRGLGREWALAALRRGDSVAATARDPATLGDLVETFGEAVLPIQLDVSDRAACFAAVRRAHDGFGRLDVVVNNAGYGQHGFVEELSEAEARAQMDTNFFGALWVTQAALPILRTQRAGHVIQVSSVGGLTAFPYLGIYHASKFALEGLTQSLAQEVAGFGVRVTLVEPAGFDTDWLGTAANAAPLDAYAAEHRRYLAARADRRAALGDPAASAAALLEIVDDPDPPLRVFFGEQALEWVRADYAQRLETWERWQPLAIRAQGRARD